MIDLRDKMIEVKPQATLELKDLTIEDKTFLDKFYSSYLNPKPDIGNIENIVQANLKTRGVKEASKRQTGNLHGGPYNHGYRVQAVRAQDHSRY